MTLLLTPSEVAEQLRVSDRQVRVWASRGYLPAIRLGRQWRIRAEDLESVRQAGLPPVPTTTAAEPDQIPLLEPTTGAPPPARAAGAATGQARGAAIFHTTCTGKEAAPCPPPAPRRSVGPCRAQEPKAR